MGRRWLVWAAAGLAVLPSAAGAAIPTTQVCKPANLPFTFRLPADWSCQGAPPYGDVVAGARAGGMAPGFVVQLNIFATATHTNAPISGYASSLVATIRERLAKLSASGKVTGLPTTVGASVPAVLITVRNGGSLLGLDYFFITGGYLYELNFGGGASWLQKYMSAIKATAKSIQIFTTA
jgi:hypothetical protein